MKTKIVRTLAVAVAAISLLSVSVYAKDYNTSGTKNYANRILDGTEGEGAATVLRGGVDRITATTEWAVPNTIHVTYKYDGKTDPVVDFTVRTSILGQNTFYYYNVEKKGTHEYWKVTYTKADTLWQNRDITLEPNDPTLTKKPTAKSLTYTGEPQALVNAGAATNGTIYYSLDNATWSKNIPTKTEAGDYTVYYKVTGNANYNNLAAASVKSTIKEPSPATVTYAMLGDYVGENDKASAWNVLIFPGDIAIESIDVKVNGKSSEEGAWEDSTVFSGPIIFSVAVNKAAEDVTSMTAVLNGEDNEMIRVNLD